MVARCGIVECSCEVGCSENFVLCSGNVVVLGVVQCIGEVGVS